MFKAIIGLKAETNGKIHRYGSKISFQSQTHNISSHLPFSILEVISLANGACKEQILELGLIDEQLMLSAWNQASGGERQRCLLTRSLLTPCDLLLLDEPFNHLDSHYQEKAIELIKKTHFRQKSRAIVMVTHDSLAQSFTGLDAYKSLTLKSCVGL